MSMPAMIAIFLLSVSSILGSAASAFSAEKPGKLTPVRIGIVSRSTLDMPFFVARERGVFREEGLEAELVLLKASMTVPAMLGGSIDFGTATGTAVSAAMSGTTNAAARIEGRGGEEPSIRQHDQPGHTRGETGVDAGRRPHQPAIDRPENAPA